jgi:Na+/H+ antiporter NhaA
MQKTATQIFIGASIVFGVVGVLMVLAMPDNDQQSSPTHIVLMKLLLATVFVILPSFALSVAGKYLKK